MCLFFFVRQIFSTLPCLDKLGVAPRKHQVTSVVLTPTCFSLWASEARQGQGRRRIFIRSLTHMYIHTRTHTAPRHAALFARHAVAPAASVVVLTREAPPQALRCSRARALTKTRGKAGCFATLAYTMHGKYEGSLNAAFVCVATAINPACKWPSPGGGHGASRAGHS